MSKGSNKKIKPAIRELLCQRCDEEYPVWFCRSEIWNKVHREDEHFLCLTCFAILAEERGLVPTAWFVDIERFDEWISVEESVPTNDRKVIIFDTDFGVDYGGWFSKKILSKKNVWFQSDGTFAKKVTHWREMITNPVRPRGAVGCSADEHDYDYFE